MPQTRDSPGPDAGFDCEMTHARNAFTPLKSNRPSVRGPAAERRHFVPVCPVIQCHSRLTWIITQWPITSTAGRRRFSSTLFTCHNVHIHHYPLQAQMSDTASRMAIACINPWMSEMVSTAKLSVSLECPVISAQNGLSFRLQLFFVYQQAFDHDLVARRFTSAGISLEAE